MSAERKMVKRDPANDPRKKDCVPKIDDRFIVEGRHRDRRAVVSQAEREVILENYKAADSVVESGTMADLINEIMPFMGYPLNNRRGQRLAWGSASEIINHLAARGLLNLVEGE